MTIEELKEMPKEKFLSLSGTSEELYNSLQNSKEGWISISRVGDGKGESGYTHAFGEGLSCRIDNIDRWYVTSVIQSIDWENHTFKTLNSVYNFEYKDMNQIEKERRENLDKMNKLFENLEKNGSKD
jgi:hypothetical protein